jgi:hypothetical protein
MKAPSRGSSSLKDEINEFLKRHNITERNDDDHDEVIAAKSFACAFFLRLRDDPDRYLDKFWKKLVDDNPSMDTAAKREAFLDGLLSASYSPLLADAVAKLGALKRMLRDKEINIKKALARGLPKTPARELLALLHDADTTLQPFAHFEKIFETLYQVKLLSLIDIRSDHASSRTRSSRGRTAFMRVASFIMHRTTGKWHDDEVATLADIAFPPGDEEEATTIRMVQSARQFMRRTPWEATRQ